ncbi:LamG-like jellyroll fold domain-containing protein [Kutzneria kofuensis]|uniref:LamG-like jellyroll fold domain-containing protein n=1 Tax=Kutzneria kofuensis TaxID=103725 RepID=UPI0031E7A805
MTAVDRMAGHLTAPFGRGADRMDLTFADRRGTVAAYDFREHIARFGALPKPRYVLSARVDVTAETVVVTHYDVPGGSAHTCTITVPAGTLAGGSFMLPLGADAATAVLRSVEFLPPPQGEANSVAREWRLSVLLGDLAALLWTIGTERDVLTAQLAKARKQRNLASAFGASLDLIGSDLGVPRLPPTPYIFDFDTIALYHLNDPANSTTVEDATELYRPGTGLRGAVDPGVALGGAGRFGTAASFDGTGGITVPDNHDFALGRGQSLTIECFAKPADGTWQGDLVRKQPADATKPGWALSVGDFGRGIPRNVRLVVSDGVATTTITLYADISLSTAEFHHIAGVVDRHLDEVRLYVDGRLRVRQDIGEFGEATNTEPVRIGAPGYRGALDEVRFSAVGLDRFHPVLGESDDSFVPRLALFREWKLPTRATIEELINKAVGDRVAGALFPFVVEDVDAPQFAGTLPVTIRPARLLPRESVDALGRRNVPEAAVCGTAADDPWYDPAMLIDGYDGRIAFYAGDPSRPRVSTLMRVATRKALWALADLLDSMGVPQHLAVMYGYEPGATDLRAVGRGLVLYHPDVPADRLAALAHKVGFSWVTHRPATDDVYASVADTTTVQIRDADGGSASRGEGFDVWEGGTFVLRTDPAPPADAVVRWSIIHYGPGRVELLDDPTLPRPMFHALKAGRLTVRAGVRRGGRTFTGSRQLRIGLEQVQANTSIGPDGARGVTESVAGTVDDAPFLPTYLTLFRDARVTGDPQALRMQPALAAILRAMLDMLITGGRTGAIHVRSGYNPDGTGLERVGRALTFDAGTVALNIESIAVLAHGAGFDYVRNTGSAIQVAHRAEDLVTISGPSEVEEGASSLLRVAPRAEPRAIAWDGTALCVLNAGTGTVSTVDPASGKVAATVKVGDDPIGIAAIPGLRYAFVAEGDSNTISTVDTGFGEIGAAIQLTEKPVAVVAHPTEDQIVIATTAKLVVMGFNFDVLSTVALPTPPTTLALDPTGATAWLGFADRTVRSVALSGTTVSAPVTMPDVVTDLAVSPTAVYAVSPGRLSIVDVPGRAVRSADNVGPAPRSVVYDATANAVYLSDATTGEVQVRTATGAETQPPRRVRLAGLVSDLFVVQNRLYATTVADPALGGTDAVAVLDPTANLAPLAFWALGSGYGERLAVSVRTGAQAVARLDGTTGHSVHLIAQQADRWR